MTDMKPKVVVLKAKMFLIMLRSIKICISSLWDVVSPYFIFFHKSSLIGHPLHLSVGFANV